MGRVLLGLAVCGSLEFVLVDVNMEALVWARGVVGSGFMCTGSERGCSGLGINKGIIWL